MERSQVRSVPERVRYRLTRLQRVLPVLPLLVVFTGAHVWGWLDGAPLGTEVTETFGMWTVMPIVLLIAGRYFGVTLTPSTAVVHSLRRRTIQWAEIQAIHMEPYQGTRTVVIYEAGGRRTRLRAPLSGFLAWDSGFDEKFHTIGMWWLEHRGPDWAAVPPPSALGKGASAPPRDPFAPPA